MSFYSINNVDVTNNLKCSPEKKIDYTGIEKCSQYISANETLNYGIDYENGIKNTLPINHVFNNEKFANSINNNNITNEYENVKQCFNPEYCKNKKLYGKENLSLDEVSNKSYTEICKNKNICEKNNFNDNYLLQKQCFNNDCNYQLYCECENNNTEKFSTISFFTPNKNYSFI
jgi:hypothetical protein